VKQDAPLGPDQVNILLLLLLFLIHLGPDQVNVIIIIPDSSSEFMSSESLSELVPELELSSSLEGMLESELLELPPRGRRKGRIKQFELEPYLAKERASGLATQRREAAPKMIEACRRGRRARCAG
jgi:hypothetical protein